MCFLVFCFFDQLNDAAVIELPELHSVALTMVPWISTQSCHLWPAWFRRHEYSHRLIASAYLPKARGVFRGFWRNLVRNQNRTASRNQRRDLAALAQRRRNKKSMMGCPGATLFTITPVEISLLCWLRWTMQVILPCLSLNWLTTQLQALC